MKRFGTIYGLVFVACAALRLHSAAPGPLWELQVERVGNNVVVTWREIYGEDFRHASLQSAPSIAGPWQTITNAARPYVAPIKPGEMFFFRVVAPHTPCINRPCPG